MAIDNDKSLAAQEETLSFQDAVAAGERFEFGKNWQHFLALLDDDRIAEAKHSLQKMLGVDSLAEKTFLDIGSGSGLFSLAAMQLGASRVRSFDYDPQSVACAQELRRRYFPGAVNWTIERGNVLETSYLNGLGAWDIVYSWGVLHHTGEMWRALENAGQLVKPNGVLFISIYNDQGGASERWRAVKRMYNKGLWRRRLVCGVFIPYFALRSVAADVIHKRNPFSGYRDYKKSRGMSRVHDWIDWLGGYPFEVARPEQIFAFYRERGFALERLTTRNGLGCNEFVFRKS